MVCLHLVQLLLELFLNYFTILKPGPETRPKEWGQRFLQLGVFKHKQIEFNELKNLEFKLKNVACIGFP